MHVFKPTCILLTLCEFEKIHNNFKFAQPVLFKYIYKLYVFHPKERMVQTNQLKSRKLFGIHSLTITVCSVDLWQE